MLHYKWKYFLSGILISLTSICLIENIKIFSFKMRQIALITIWYRKIIYIVSYVCLTVLLANSLCLSYFMYINMSDNIGFCLNILHFDWCLCNFVLADWAFGSVFIIVLNINCLTKNDLSGILDTTDTNFLDPWSWMDQPSQLTHCWIGKTDWHNTDQVVPSFAGHSS